MQPMDEDTDVNPIRGNAGGRHGGINALNTAEHLKAGISAGNIARSGEGPLEVLDLPEVRWIWGS